MGSQFSNSSVNTFNMLNLVAFCLVGLATAAPAPQTANEVATRIVAVSKSKPELLSTAVSQADPDLLRVALTDADPLEVALTKAKAELLGTALTRGVKGELLRTA